MTPLPPHATALEREQFEERAAIKEYDGNLSREAAEREAWAEIFEKKKPQGGLSR